MRVIRKYGWLILAGAIVLTLFISSSMSYQQQTVVPLLSRWLPEQAPWSWLSGIHFTYANAPISTEAMGFPAFVEFFIRKAAHFSIFLVFSFALSHGLTRLAHRPGWHSLAGVAVSFVLAAGDEFHQSLTHGRSPLFQDVILDTCGAAVGALLAFGLWRRHRSRR
ncbi:VanZ family protein [Lacticaseibacillus suihuaensis]